MIWNSLNDLLFLWEQRFIIFADGLPTTTEIVNVQIIAVYDGI